jgi:hypothetical protein
MPVARGRRVDARSALVVGATGVVVAIVIGAILVYLSSRNDIKVRLGDDRFQSYDAASAASEIADRGPILLPDLANRGRDIYLQHLSDQTDQGWVAFDARPLDERRDCVLVWDAQADEFHDNGKCTRSLTVPADGGDLPHYPVSVNDDGKVVVDLRAAGTTTDQTATTAPTTTPTSTSTSTEG